MYNKKKDGPEYGATAAHVELGSNKFDVEFQAGNESPTSFETTARAANEAEHTLTIGRALRMHVWAVLWSLTISMSIIMEGYDTILVNSFFGYPAFQRQFGVATGPGSYQVSGAWQSALGAGGMAGCVVGSFLNGYLVKFFGFKKVFTASLAAMAAFVFISFFGSTIQLQVVGQVLCGLPWGIFATLAPAYASEMLPLALRPYLTAYTNMCFAIGQLIGAGVLQSLEGRDDQWSYRIPFAVQWVWPVPLFFISFFMPESPWWLVRNGRHEEAERVIARRLMRDIGGPDKLQEEAHAAVAMMIHTNNLERKIEEGSSYIDCLRGSNRRRTEIACLAFAGQVLAGIQFAYSGTYFFEQAGMSPADAYKLSLGGTAVAFTGTLLCLFLMKTMGRRTMYVWGMGLACVYLATIGFLTLSPDAGSGSGSSRAQGVLWAQSSLCILWLFTYSLTVGPIGWSIPPEVSSTRLRSKTICLARNSYYIIVVAANVIEPYMMNPTAWNWRGKTGFFWAGTALCVFVWAVLRLPETKGRTFEELDVMFADGVPTWKFKKYKVDVYIEGHPEREDSRGSAAAEEQKDG